MTTTVAGRVLTTEGEPVGGAEVVLERHLIVSAPNRGGGCRVHFDALDPPTGLFAVARPVERHPDTLYSLQFMIQGFKTWSLDQFKVGPNETLERVRVEFEKSE